MSDDFLKSPDAFVFQVLFKEPQNFVVSDQILPRSIPPFDLTTKKQYIRMFEELVSNGWIDPTSDSSTITASIFGLGEQKGASDKRCRIKNGRWTAVIFDS